MTTPPDDVLDLLTAYALDMLEPEEARRVAELVADQPELRQTLEELRATVDAIPYALPDAAPDPGLRQRTLDYATGARSTKAAPLTNPLRRWVYALAATTAGALLAVALLWSQLAATRNELARTQAALVAQAAIQREIIASIAAADSAARLVGNGEGTVLHSGNIGSTLYVKLPALAPGRAYQLWLLEGNAAPISAGVFTVDQDGYGTLELLPEALAQVSTPAFAVTEEPNGGSPGPTSKPLISNLPPSA